LDFFIKIVLTGGTKTIYSWDTDKGEITQKTETVKSHTSFSVPIASISDP
jgi:hypothetical protein